MADNENLGEALIPRVVGIKDCGDPVVTGTPSMRYDFVRKPHNEDNIDLDSDLSDLVPPSCTPWYYYNMKVGSLLALEDVEVTGNIECLGNVIATGEVSSGAHVLSNKKNLPFDMEHPNKKGWRLRHVCIEGPEIAVYCRGTVHEDGIIRLPSYWNGLVNTEDMTINLTPIGHWQELYIKKIKKNKIIIKNNKKNKIHANYHIVARRLDDDLIVEYKGNSYLDYPNGNEGYSFNFEHTYMEKLIKDEVKTILSKNND